MQRGRTLWVAIPLLAAAMGCQAQQVDQSASAIEAVRAADLAWADTFARKDVEGYLGFVEASATIQQPNGPAVTGHEAIRGLIEGFLALPNLSGTWHPVNVHAAASGEFAYSTGTYEFTYDGPDGHQAKDQGKYLEVWRKQTDGSWKMTVESFNSDAPLPGMDSGS